MKMRKYIVEWSDQHYTYQVFEESEPNTILFRGSEEDCHFEASVRRAADELEVFNNQECEFDYV
ncbi:hypothetical protein EBT25_10470 [bacterium]|jgi:hypothetical protein|nr:hypothetical protein [bacterium]